VIVDFSVSTESDIGTAIEYAGEREIFDEPLAAYQLTQEKLANMTLELGRGMLLALHLGPAEGRRRRPSRAGQPRQAQQRPGGHHDRPRVPDVARRRGHHSLWSTR
jgi:alkylation response protein AidB-like acyl-CoA dehydrogenase